MKWGVIVLMLLSVEAMAFDLTGWNEKRALHLHEAERLRAAYSNCVARIDQPAEDVSVPLETFEDGSVKVMVYAKKAQYFLQEGYVWAQGVVIRKFKDDGTVGAKIVAESCVVDRYSKSGWAEGPATVEHGKSRFSGKGIYFSSPDAYIKVFEASDCVSEDLKFGGGGL